MPKKRGWNNLRWCPPSCFCSHNYVSRLVRSDCSRLTATVSLSMRQQVILSALHCCPLTRKDWEVAADEGIFCDLCERLCRTYGEWCDHNSLMHTFSHAAFKSCVLKLKLDGNVRATSGFRGIVRCAMRTSVAAASKKPGTPGPAEAANHLSRMLETRLI